MNHYLFAKEKSTRDWLFFLLFMVVLISHPITILNRWKFSLKINKKKLYIYINLWHYNLPGTNIFLFQVILFPSGLNHKQLFALFLIILTGIVLCEQIFPGYFVQEEMVVERNYFIGGCLMGKLRCKRKRKMLGFIF